MSNGHLGVMGGGAAATMTTADSSKDEYFTSYDDLEVHKLMLEDVPRTTAYQQAIEMSGEAIRGKVVLDVGAGSGILSLFCMRAGAKRVYAVEASDLARPLVDIVRMNGGENIIQVIQSRVEDVVLPEKVDVIVSEWMGFYLLHESMLDSVLNARDRFLKEDTGIMMPSHATIYAAPCSMQEYWQSNIKFWDNVYGFNMSALGQEAMRRGQGVGAKPEVKVLKPEQILADPQIYVELDLRTCTLEDIDSITNRHFVSIRRAGPYHGIALWFDCKFVTTNTVLSTSPLCPPTHWMQTVIVTAVAAAAGQTATADDDLNVEEDEVIGWELSLSRAATSNGGEEKTSRNYAIQVKALDPVDDTHPVPCQCMLAKCVLMQTLLNEELCGDDEEIMDM